MFSIFTNEQKMKIKRHIDKPPKTEGQLKNFIGADIFKLLRTNKLIIEKPEKGKKSKFEFTDEAKQFFSKVVISETEKTKRVSRVSLDIEDLVERIGEKVKTILREESTISPEQSVISFYKFTKDLNDYLDRNLSYGKRIYFDKIFYELRLPQNSLYIFKTYLKDLNLIFPNKIRMNPMVPSNVLPRIIIEMGGTKYDSIVVTGPIL